MTKSLKSCGKSSKSHGKSIDVESWLARKVDWLGKLIYKESQVTRKVEDF